MISKSNCAPAGTQDDSYGFSDMVICWWTTSNRGEGFISPEKRKKNFCLPIILSQSSSRGNIYITLNLRSAGFSDYCTMMAQSLWYPLIDGFMYAVFPNIANDSKVVLILYHLFIEGIFGKQRYLLTINKLRRGNRVAGNSSNNICNK